MGIYHARDLLALNDDELWGIPHDEYHTLICSDGSIDIVGADLINTVLLWWPLNDYPNVPIKLKWVHDSDMDFKGNSNLKVLNTILWGIHSYHDERVDPEMLALAAIRTMNRWYNHVTVRCAASVTTMSILDVLEVMKHPEIEAANASVQPTRHSIEEVTQPRIKAVFNNPNELMFNPIAMGIRCGTQKVDQCLQCFGPRGFVTDFTSDLFKDPILTGYVQGIWDLYSTMIESRSGTKAALFNKELLRNTEYFNRMTQLIAQYVKTLHHGDCGTPHLEDVPVLPNIFPRLVGKYYQKEDGTLDWIRGDEKHLINTTIKIRSVLSCIHPGAGVICSVCYGRMSFSVPHGTNLGQVSAVPTCDQITSSVLSTKHTDLTSKVDRLQLTSTEGRYLRYGKVEEALYIREEWKHHPIRLVIDKTEAPNIVDIRMLKDLTGYPASNATAMTQVHIQVETAEGTISDVLTVSLYNRRSSLTIDVLEYLRVKGWEYDPRGNIIVDLTDFDFSKPVLVLPNKHVNMYEVMKRFRSFLHSGSEDGARTKLDPTEYTGKIYLKNFKDPIQGVIATANMLNEKLRVNFVHCEILAYAMMVTSAVNRDYRLPKPGVSGSFEKYTRLMQHRSMAGAMAFEKQHEPLNNPASITEMVRNDHPYDIVLMGGKMS